MARHRLFAAGLLCVTPAVFANPALRVPRLPVNWPEITSDWVTTPEQLVRKLEEALAGATVRIEVAADIDLSGHAPLTLASDIELIGQRGALGRRPRLFTKDRSLADGAGYSLFEVWGNRVRIEGIHFEGPADTDRDRGSDQPTVSAITVHQRKVKEPVTRTDTATAWA